MPCSPVSAGAAAVSAAGASGAASGAGSSVTASASGAGSGAAASASGAGSGAAPGAAASGSGAGSGAVASGSGAARPRARVQRWSRRLRAQAREPRPPAQPPAAGSSSPPREPVQERGFGCRCLGLRCASGVALRLQGPPRARVRPLVPLPAQARRFGAQGQPRVRAPLRARLPAAGCFRWRGLCGGRFLGGGRFRPAGLRAFGGSGGFGGEGVDVGLEFSLRLDDRAGVGRARQRRIGQAFGQGPPRPPARRSARARQGTERAPRRWRNGVR